VHFFDDSLPRWPTVSLNLGLHPEDAPHQDIWLPQDWDDLTIPVKTLGGSGVGFGQAIFNTAMSWRDSLQSALPGYRNRIAQVRTSPGEGGTNLFMPREIIASMALRGALAGARLRTRFVNAGQWDRFRWLRLRTAMSDLEQLRDSTRAGGSTRTRSRAKPGSTTRRLTLVRSLRGWRSPGIGRIPDSGRR
jgi:hypothetical protein